MSTLFWVLLIGLAGGIAVGFQAPLASLMGDKIGILESIFFIHLSGTIAAAIPLALERGGNLSRWREVPWYALVAGVFGLAVIGAMNWTIPRVGVAPAILLVLAGQLVVGIVLDHHGWLGVSVHPVSVSRLAGIGLVFLGVWLTMK
jgi:transporter family-2 protein